MSADNPYRSLPERAFWRKAVADKGVYGLQDLWTKKWDISANSAFATYGSCFAQHISRALLARDGNWVNEEPAPGDASDALARKYNYNIFSSRTANIYTARQLMTWLTLAENEDQIADIEIWENDGRFRDSLRPMIEPNGFATEDECRLSLQSTVRAFRRTVQKSDVFVFTMGLTEGWEHAETGQVYAMCPGTNAGSFDPKLHVFKNYTFQQNERALTRSLNALRRLNKRVKVLLTVSPVPLTATASGQHVLLATQYSKSVLRALAGQMAAQVSYVDYFPSYELIVGAPTRSAFFAPNLRSVELPGVDVVMGHFFKGLGGDETGSAAQAPQKPAAKDARSKALEAELAKEDLVCEEMALEAQSDG